MKRYYGSSIHTNKAKLKTRTEKLDGVEYLVAPVVMVKEQVLNGEFLPAEEIAKSAIGWNGRPVVVYHPVKDGKEVIANDPEVVPKYEVGKIYNVEYEEATTKLKGEVWVDISKAKRKNEDTKIALDMIKNNEELEVSTGYVVNDRLEKKGEFNGVEYNAIQRDILPDHLALLPNEIGACSWEDGAGVRNNSIFSWLKKLVTNITSRGSIQNQVSNAIKKEYDDFDWINDLVHDDETGKDFAVFMTRGIRDDDDNIKTPSKMYAIEYSFDQDTNEVVLGDTLQEVEPVQQYITKNVKEEQTLKKHEQLVRDVIANSKGKFGRKDQHTLINCSESVLLSMLPAAKRKAYVTNKGKSGKLAINVRKKFISNIFKGAKFTVNEGEEVMVEELIEMAPEDVATTIESIEDVAELEAIAVVLEEVIEVADVIAVVGEDISTVDTNEEFIDMVDEVVQAAEEVLAVVEEAIEELDGSEGDPAANMDTSDIVDPPENAEEDTVSALETASRKLRRNSKSKRAKTRINDRKTKPKKSMSINDYINSIPDSEAREFIKNGVAESKRHRQSLLSDLTGNKNCQFSESELKKMETNQLEKIHVMLGVPKTSRQVANSSVLPRNVGAATREENLGYIPLTTNIFKKEDK